MIKRIVMAVVAAIGLTAAAVTVVNKMKNAPTGIAAFRPQTAAAGTDGSNVNAG